MATRKQALAEQVCNAENEYRALKGMDKKEFSQYDYNEMARKNREYELHSQLEKWQGMIGKEREAQEIMAKREAFYATEAGAAYKAAREEAVEYVKDAIRENKEAYENWLNHFAVKYLGENWGVKGFSDSYANFAIKNGEKFVFGSEIDVYYTERWFGDGERFEVNIGSMGSFNPLDTDPLGRGAFYVGFGKLVSNYNALTFLRSRMKMHAQHRESLRDRLQELKDELNNPKIEEA